jgi:17beta-estradiol 17-dehydrogenase / very-long-chain 3-oxoacyl-CoA reductase
MTHESYQNVVLLNHMPCLISSLVAIFITMWVLAVLLPTLILGSTAALVSRYNKNGSSWAVVTGTTSGIGLAFAKALCRIGFNVLMVSRNEQKLKEMKDEISKSNKNIKVEYLSIDLSQSSGEVLTGELRRFFTNNNVTVLVNNAGVNTEFPKLFSDCTSTEIQSILNVNVNSVVSLTRLFIESNRSGRKLLINLSSLFGELAGPLVSVYSGSKSFIQSFSASLSAEDPTLDVFCSIPGFVVSNMSKMKRTSLTVISADQCADTVLRQAARGWFISACPHWTHSVIRGVMLALPERLRLVVLSNINSKTNKAAIRKLEKLSKKE